MTTLAKSKAQALVQPAKPLAVTPNVRLFNSPAAGATLSLSTESTNIVQVVNPASTLSINVDSQNFSAFGANHFVLQVDTTAATEITLNFVRGTTILATKVIEIDADQIAVLTFAAITKANDAVTLLALGQHVVGKSEATDGNGAVGGLPLVPTGATESADGEFQRFVPDATEPLGYPAYYAELDPNDWHAGVIQVTFKWPALTVVDNALVIFFVGGDFDSIENSVGDETDSIYAALQIARTSGGGQGEPYNFANFDFYKFGVEPPTSEPVTLTPTAGDIATLTFNRTQMTLTVDGETQVYAIPADVFAGVSLLNVAAKVESAVLPLSIKAAQAEEA